MPVTIEELILKIGDKDNSADDLVPPLERDPLLVGLARFAQRLRAGAVAQNLQMKK